MDPLTTLAGSLRDLPVGPPVAAIVLLGEVVRRAAPALNINSVSVEPSIALGQQSGPLTRCPPTLGDLAAHRLGVGVTIDEPQLMRMRVPAVRAVGNFERANQPLVAMALLKALPRCPCPQALQRVGLLAQ